MARGTTGRERTMAMMARVTTARERAATRDTSTGAIRVGETMARGEGKVTTKVGCFFRHYTQIRSNSFTFLGDHNKGGHDGKGNGKGDHKG
jgi:hypothetical protein